MSSYASATVDLPKYRNPSILGAQVTTPQIQAALDARSSFADGFFSRYGYAYSAPGYGVGGSLPSPYDPSLIMSVCHLGFYDLLVLRGFNPQGGADDNYKNDMLLALEWLKKISRQETQLLCVPAPSTAQQPGASPMILSDPLQGFVPSFGSGRPFGVS